MNSELLICMFAGAMVVDRMNTAVSI